MVQKFPAGQSQPIYIWNKRIGCQKIKEGVDFFLDKLSGICGVVDDSHDLILIMCEHNNEKSAIFAVKNPKGCGIIPKIEIEFQKKLDQQN